MFLAGQPLISNLNQSRYKNYGNALTSKAKVVFCDGQAESPTLPFLFEDTSDAALTRWKS